MSACLDLDHLLTGPARLLALAPMQDVTNLPFLNLMTGYGGADLYFTEYFRAYQTSCLDKNILRSPTENQTRSAVIAQMSSNDIAARGATARELQHYPFSAVDLN